jgi:hypothetical protein
MQSHLQHGTWRWVCSGGAEWCRTYVADNRRSTKLEQERENGLKGKHHK